MDVGYSKEKAEKGADWLEKHGWNLTFTDTFPLHSGTIDKRIPWDEKPHPEDRPWSEKSSKGNRGNI